MFTEIRGKKRRIAGLAQKRSSKLKVQSSNKGIRGEVQSSKFKVQTKESIPNERSCDASSMCFTILNFGVCLNFGF
jgi:hypothetical protein